MVAYAHTFEMILYPELSMELNGLAFPVNPYDESPHYAFDDIENGKRGRLELRYVYYERKPHTVASPALQSCARVGLETAVVLTKVMGYGTTAIAKQMADVKMVLMQERDVAEFAAFHNWIETDGYAIGAKEILFRSAANSLMRRRMREVRILCARGLFTSVIDAGLRLSGMKNTQIMHDPRVFHRDIDSILGRYDTRTLVTRIAPFHPTPSR